MYIPLLPSPALSFYPHLLTPALPPPPCLQLIPALTAYVAESMGHRFVEPLPFAIEPSYNDSNATTPLIFVLSPGACTRRIDFASLTASVTAS